MILLLLPLLSLACGAQFPIGTDGGVFSDVMDEPVRSGCEYPFVPVGSGCFYFSEETRNFEGAKKACENLGTYHVNLATFDMDENEDAALLLEVASKDKIFWVGGSTDDGENWEWVDGRSMYMQAPILYYDEPNESQNKCMTAQVSISGNNRRAYLYDYSCDESVNFICQIGCPWEFRMIGQHCYFISEEEGVSHLTWDDARDYCVGLDVPSGYHSDLAVLGLDSQDSYRLMNSLVAGHDYIRTWLGAHAEVECVYKWVDGRDFPISSPYWFYTEPHCGDHKTVYLDHDIGLNRTYLRGQPRNGYDIAFACQLFKD